MTSRLVEKLLHLTVVDHRWMTMPSRFRRLKKTAAEYCKARGHTMERFKHILAISTSAFSKCTKCGRIVIVNPYPRTNGLKLSGNAIKFNCTKKRG
jgi:hypothetical protein